MFDSLGSEIGRLLDQFDYDTPTDVAQLSTNEATEIKQRVLDWQQILYAGQPVAISNQDVLDLLNSLRQTDPAIRDKGAFFF
ncbi:hypothetical protein NL524_30680, partial [Klebsiella pneumoniae]|nr:hypothetical protein [Klebsiella pneumoniae]